MKEVHGGNVYKYDRRMYDFSANLNPLGMPPEVRSAIIDNPDSYQAYPDIENRELTGKVAKYLGVPENFLVFGNGASDIIFRLALYLRPRKTLIVSPAFAEYERAAKTAGSAVNHFFLREENGFAYDERAVCLIDDDTDLVFICNPGNPTGVAVEKEKVLELADRCGERGAILMVDECFSEFLHEEERYSILPYIEEHPNAVVLKAFTKIYAMAGLRLGYAVSSHRELVERLRETLQPWPVSTPASKAGGAAVEIKGFIEETKDYVRREREYLMRELKALGFHTYDSTANFVFIRSSMDLSKALLPYDIMVRSCGNYPGLDESYFRIAVRTEAENRYLIKCLRDWRRKDAK